MGIRLLIADDHAVLRKGVATLVGNTADMEVVAEAGDATTTLSEAKRLQPDVVLLDLAMPGVSGMSLVRDLAASAPNSGILVLTMHEDASIVRAAIEAGARGYLVKRAVATEIIDAVRAVASGQMYVHAAVAKELLFARKAAPAADALTTRETEVARLLARGFTNRETADQLNISMRTVEGHRASIMRKLDGTSRADLVRYCEQRGLI